MNPEIKQQWLDALRSGTYQQCQNQLSTGSTPNKYCCLGVLCDIVDPAGWTTKHEHHFKDDYPNERVLQHSGLGFDIAQKLATMNDEENATFGDIADYIEENL